MYPIDAAARPIPAMDTAASNTTDDATLRAAAKALEASFLAEMLNSAGYGKPRESFGGGVGEDQYASFVVRAHAEKIVDAGGIGLAEHLFEALKERQDGSV